MRTEEQYNCVKTRTKRYCDDCGKEIIREDYCSQQCYICGKDICKECVSNSKYYGDTYVVFCNSCCNTYNKHKPELDRLELERDTVYKLFLKEAKEKRIRKDG
jgi:hypothetical protein